MTEIQRLPEGESGLAPKNLTDERLDAVVAWFSMPDKLRRSDPSFPHDVPALAKRLGVGVRDLERWRKEPRIYNAVAENTRMCAVYLMPDVLWEQGRLAIEKQDSKAARYVAQIAGVMGDGSAKVEINNTNVNNSSLEVSQMADGALFAKAANIWQKIKDATPAADYSE